MNIFAIGDLHLSFKNKINIDNWEEVHEYKPMNIFGDKWEKHYYKIYKNWLKLVTAEDIVLIPGDISWATTFEELHPDLDFISKLPGKKVFIRGNHDYWWQGISKLRSKFPDNCYLIQNDSISFGNIAIAGSRGWTAPNDFKYNKKDDKIFNRELIRLKLSLEKLKNSANIRIVMIHYMPVNEKHQYNKIIELFKLYNIDLCIYGHLHGKESHLNSLTGIKWGIKFCLVSADYLNFIPKQIL